MNRNTALAVFALCLLPPAYTFKPGTEAKVLSSKITKDEIKMRKGKQPKEFRRLKDWEMSNGKNRR